MPEPPAELVAWVRGAAKVKRLALPVGILVGMLPLLLSLEHLLLEMMLLILLFSGWLLQLLCANAMLPLQIGKD
uniref:Uncharacterized protein n=1 Tax=Quercus lobata TaxID=97700 RepID=A0A7N2MJW7_QUELO